MVIATDELKQALQARLLAENKTASCAESCTGGLVAKYLTDLAGSSKVFAGGFVTYCDEMKTAMLGVKKETLEAHHAVSAEAAKEMAAGALNRTGADAAVSTTGVAGPSLDDSGKPVGTVYIGIACKNAEPKAYEYHFEGARESVREQAARQALTLLLESVTL